MAVKTTHDASLTEATLKSDVEFFNAHSKMNEKGETRTITQGNYLDRMSSKGVERHAIETVASAESELHSAMIHIATDDLKQRVDAERAAGRSADGLESYVKMQTVSGSAEVRIEAKKAKRQGNFPRKTEDGAAISDEPKPVEYQYGKVSFGIDVDKKLNRSTIDRARTVIEDAMGIS